MEDISNDELDKIKNISKDWVYDPSGQWLFDEDSNWLYDPKLDIIFHTHTGVLYGKDESGWCVMNDEKNLVENNTETSNFDEFGSFSSENEENDESEDEIELDLENQLISGSASLKSSSAHKELCEDKFVTHLSFPMSIISNNNSLCYYYAMFDGHCGDQCANYAQQHLHNNIISSFRQSINKVKKNRINVRKKAKLANTHSTEIESLKLSCSNGFQMTENNFINMAKKKGLQDGSTACCVIIFGPDEDGSLKLITSNIGDSRAILCKNGKPYELTKDHKPNREDEMKRIQGAGGKVMNVKGLWRVVSNRTKQQPEPLALSVSRSFGDLVFKQQNLISAEPEIKIFDIDLNDDYFIVIGSDGIFDVLSNQEIIDKVLENSDKTPENVCEIINEFANEKGSIDDKTTTVIYFGWNKNVWGKNKECVHTHSPENEENSNDTSCPQEEETDDNIFKIK